MKVIICAAGNSKRMGKATKHMPKSLLPIGNTTLVENLVSQFSKGEVNEIIIIVGYLGHLIKQTLGSVHNGVVIRYIENRDYATTNNMYSILKAKDHINCAVTFASADLLLSSSICRKFISESNPNMILVDDNPKYFYEEDPVKVTITENRITAIDKKLEQSNINGVAPGLYKMSAYATKDYFRYSEKLIEEGNLQFGYIEPLKLMINKHEFTPYVVGESLWCDIDTPSEYNIARKIYRRMT